MKQNKGRSKELIQLRNKKLVERYYYWTEIKRRRFDDALQILSRQEFFISEQRIEIILRDNNDSLNMLYTQKEN